jgi:DNA-binding NtrC family response regulator
MAATTEQLSLTAWRQLNAPTVVGEHPALLKALATAQAVAPLSCPVMITGETGTGKELFASAIHSASGRKPWVAVNCAAVPDSLIESELFGFAKGAFSGATAEQRGAFTDADGGTLFLDEVAEMPLGVQSKLLRVLETGVVKPIGSAARRVTVRVICATNRDAQDKNVMRPDLYHRLCRVHIHLPELRQRKIDIAATIHYFVASISAEIGAAAPAVDAALMQQLIDFPWPGNCRELYNYIYSYVAVGLDAIRDRLINGVSAVGHHEAVTLGDGFEINSYLDSIRDALVAKALAITNSNKAAAAELLGIKRTTLVEHLKSRQLRAA